MAQSVAMAQLVAIGDTDHHIAIKWHHWCHLNGIIGNQWRSPIAPMATTIGDGVRQWCHWTASPFAPFDRHWRHLYRW
jgi:hypothetical protein